MSYVEKMISRNEKIVTMTTIHWVYMVFAAMYLALFVGLAFFVHNSMVSIGSLTPYINEMLLRGFRLDLPLPRISIAWFIAIPGIYIFIARAFDYIGSEVCVTTKKFIYKQGLIWITVDDIDIDEIQSETVYQGIFGPIFNYGRLVIDSRFVKDLRIPPVIKPYVLLKKLHETQEDQEPNVILE